MTHLSLLYFLLTHPSLSLSPFPSLSSFSTSLLLPPILSRIPPHPLFLLHLSPSPSHPFSYPPSPSLPSFPSLPPILSPILYSLPPILSHIPPHLLSILSISTLPLSLPSFLISPSPSLPSFPSLPSLSPSHSFTYLILSPSAHPSCRMLGQYLVQLIAARGKALL